jgi:hypothetical protein
MPIVPKRFSLFGDSLSSEPGTVQTSSAKRIAINPKFAGGNDYAIGGTNSLDFWNGYTVGGGNIALFGQTKKTATWTRSAAVATITQTAHGYATGDTIYVNATSDVAALNYAIYSVAVLDVNRYTVPCANAGGASGTCTTNYTFQTHIKKYDDSDIVIIRLGNNNTPDGWLSNAQANEQTMVGVDYNYCMTSYLQICQATQAAGKRLVIVGANFLDATRIAAPGGTLYGLAANIVGANLQRIWNINTAARIIAAWLNGVAPLTWVGCYGTTAGAYKPAVPVTISATASSTYDGIHPTKPYQDAISDYIGNSIVVALGL